MKKSIAIILSFILIMAIILPASAFSSNTVQGIKLDKSKITLKVGQTYKLKVTLTPKNTTQKKLTYVSGDKKIATIDATGKIKGVSKGTTTITVYTYNKKIYAKCNVTISQPINIGKYETPIEVTTVKNVNAAIGFVEGETIDKNIWYDSYLTDYNIILKNLWTAPTSNYSQRVNVAIASGDLPDFMMVNMPQMKRLQKADLLLDMTKLYEDYASPLTKKVINSDGGLAIKSSTTDGKLYAIPSPVATYLSASILFVRGDWLKNVALNPPKTVDEFMKVAEAFVSNDPDKNGKKDTYALAMQKDISNFGQLGLFNMFGAYPQTWYPNSSGKLVYGDVQPEVKTALSKIQEMFKAGLIDPEFGVKDETKMTQTLQASGAGMVFSNHGFPFSVSSMVMKDTTIDWIPVAIPSDNGKSGKSAFTLSAPDTFYVIMKKAKNPEAVIKLLNFDLDKGYGPKGRDELFMNNNKKTSGRAWQRTFWIGDASQMSNIYLGCKQLRETGKEDGVTSDAKANFTAQQLWIEKKDLNSWRNFRWSGELSSLSVINYYVTSKNFVANEYYGVQTDNMLSFMPTLTTMRDETFTRIINNAESVDKFDEFVNNWRKLGGDQITKEVNEWAKTKK